MLSTLDPPPLVIRETSLFSAIPPLSTMDTLAELLMTIVPELPDATVRLLAWVRDEPLNQIEASALPVESPSVTVPAPREAAFAEEWILPFLMTSPPLKVLAPDSDSVPPPHLVSECPPLITPFTDRAAVDSLVQS